MEITDVRVSPRDEERLKAFVTITFDEAFVVRGVKVIAGLRGLFVAMPSRRRPDGKFQDIAHPIHRAMRARVEDRVLEEYDRVLRGEVEAVDWEAATG
jgi:stage V sporulation protein G